MGDPPRGEDATDPSETAEQANERAPKPTVKGMAPLQRPPAAGATDAKSDD